MKDDSPFRHTLAVYMRTTPASGLTITPQKL